MFRFNFGLYCITRRVGWASTGAYRAVMLQYHLVKAAQASAVPNSLPSVDTAAVSSPPPPPPPPQQQQQPWRWTPSQIPAMPDDQQIVQQQLTEQLQQQAQQAKSTAAAAMPDSPMGRLAGTAHGRELQRRGASLARVLFLPGAAQAQGVGVEHRGGAGAAGAAWVYIKVYVYKATSSVLVFLFVSSQVKLIISTQTHNSPPLR